MTTYNDVFTGGVVYPTDVSLTKVALDSNIQLYWPLEAQPNQPVASSIIQIDSASVDNLKIAMPSAASASVGDTTLFNNLSSRTVVITDQTGTQILSLGSGQQWQVYLDTNTSAAGVWKVYQFGATTSTANASVLAGNGLKAVGATLQQSVSTIGFTGSFTLASTDRALFYNFMGAGAGTVVTLPDPTAVGNDWFVQLRNSGTASFTVNCPGSTSINGLSTLVFNQEDSAFITCDGSNFYTVGLGQDPVFAFDYAVVDVTGAANYVLSGSELNRVAYEFTGVMAASFSVVVPNTVQQYWVYDNTTAGAFTLSIKTASQVTPLNLVRGDRVITYCTGSSVVPTSAAAVVGAINGGAF